VAPGEVLVRPDQQRILRDRGMAGAPVAHLLRARAARLDAEHDELPGRAVRRPDAVQLGRLEHTRFAPRGEEIDHHRPAAEAGEAHGMTVEVGERELGSGRTGPTRLTGTDRERERRAQERCGARIHRRARSAEAMKSFRNASGPFNAVKRLVASRKPTPTSTSPEPISSVRKCFRTRAKAWKKRSMLHPASRNGTARPAE